MSRKSKKPEMPVYETSATNRQMLNYRVYKMTANEKLLYSAMAFVVGAAVAYLFYGGIGKDIYGNATTLTHVLDAIVLLAGGLGAVKIFLPVRTAQLLESRRRELRRQFLDLLDSLATSIAAGNNVPTAFAAAQRDLSVQYTQDAYIMQEIDNILSGIQNNIDVSSMILNFGERSGIKDIRTFGRVFETAYAKGASLKDVVRNSHAILSGKCEIEMEIETKVASNKNEQNIMLVMPVILIIMIKMGGSDFANNFTTPAGLVSTTIAIAAFVGSYYLGRRILKIEV